MWHELSAALCNFLTYALSMYINVYKSIQNLHIYSHIDVHL